MCICKRCGQLTGYCSCKNIDPQCLCQSCYVDDFEKDVEKGWGKIWQM